MPLPTIKDVAQAAGISPGAVSLILRQRGRFSPATRERVHAAAKKLHYRPNPIIAAYKTNKFKGNRTTLATPLAYLWRYHRPVLPRLREAAQALGYRIESFNIDNHPDPARLCDILHNRGMRGILLGQLYGYDTLPDLGWTRFACVCVSRPFFPVPFDVVRAPIFEPIIECVQIARQRGYRRIGLDLRQHSSWDRHPHPDDRARLGAALYCQHLLPPADQIPPHTGNTQSDATFLAWFNRHRPDVVISSYESRAALLTRPCAFIVLERTTTTPAPLTGWNHSRDTVMLKALETLDHHIRLNRYGPQHSPLEHLTQLTWHEGQTLPPP